MPSSLQLKFASATSSLMAVGGRNRGSATRTCAAGQPTTRIALCAPLTGHTKTRLDVGQREKPRRLVDARGKHNTRLELGTHNQAAV